MTPHAEMLLEELKDIARDFWDDSPLGARLTAVHIGLAALLEVQSAAAGDPKGQNLVCANCGDDERVDGDPLYPWLGEVCAHCGDDDFLPPDPFYS